MAERAHPDLPGFKDKWFGLVKSKYKKALLDRYAFCNRFIAGKTVMDVPCGVGWGSSMLKDARKVVGVDISSEAVEHAKKKYNKPGLDFMVGDMAILPAKPESFDVIVCLEGFEHVPREVGRSFISETLRVLKDRGLLIMTCPILTYEGADTGNPYHLYEYPEKELVSLLNENFSIVELTRIDGPDGPIIRFVGRKVA